MIEDLYYLEVCIVLCVKFYFNFGGLNGFFKKKKRLCVYFGCKY